MSVTKLFDVFSGQSVRVENGSQADLPIFGRFAAIVRRDSVRLCRDDESGEWWIGLPNGCTQGVGDLGEAETREQADAMLANLGWTWSGWGRDEQAARATAVESAKARHNAKAAESEAYRAKFGAAIVK